MIAASVLVGFLIAVGMRIPVFAAMGICAILGMFALKGPEGLAQEAAFTISQSFNSFVLVAIPLYILVGTLMEQGQFSEKLFRFASSWVGTLRGGLGVATVGTCALFSTICGSSVATVATIGLVAFPLLIKNGYEKGVAGALIASGGTLGILIPPSIALILYGIISEQSISKLFLAGVIPGIILSCMMAIYIMFVSPKKHTTERFNIKNALEETVSSSGILLLPLLILITIYTGTATPTEAAAIAVAYVLVYGLLTKTLNIQKIRDATKQAASTTVMIFMLLGFGRLFTEFFIMSGLSESIIALTMSLGLSKFGITFAMVVIYLILGMVIEATSMLLVTVPILLPVAIAAGIDPIAFGIFVVLAVEAAQITPPVGINLFTMLAIGKLDLRSITCQILPYLIMIILLMFMVVFVDEIATWLPQTM